MRAALGLVVLMSGVALAEPAPPTTVTRPLYVRADGGFGSPTGIMGLSAGYAVRPPWSVELGGGIGASGLQLAVLGRWHHPAGDSSWSSWTIAAGPSLSLIGQPIGFHVTHSDDVAVGESDVFYILGGNVEIGWEGRARWGGLLRVAIGGFLRFSENMSGLCPEETSGAKEGPCGSLHLPTAPEVARLVAYPYFVFGYGWAF